MEKYESAVQLWAGIKNPRARLPLAPPPVKVMRLLGEAVADADQVWRQFIEAANPTTK
jgi:hypothetical protein